MFNHNFYEIMRKLYLLIFFQAFLLHFAQAQGSEWQLLSPTPSEVEYNDAQFIN